LNFTQLNFADLLDLARAMKQDNYEIVVLNDQVSRSFTIKPISKIENFKPMEYKGPAHHFTPQKQHQQQVHLPYSDWN
jgi:hypothetical protein